MRGGPSKTRQVNSRYINYFSIHGTGPGELVSAESKLAIEVTKHLILSSMNLRGEFVVPDSLINFRGSKMKNAITIETSSYSISFGDKSVYDKASE